MPKVQAETYKNVVRNFREEKGSAFSVIAKLRDISLHPRLSTMRVESLSPEEANKIIVSPKFFFFSTLMLYTPAL